MLKALGTLLVLALGLTWRASAELPGLFETAPTEVSCADLANGLPAKRWVRVTGCRPLAAEAYQDAISKEELRLFVPVSAYEDAGNRVQATVRLANPDVATALRNLKAEADRTPPPARTFEGWARESSSHELVIEEGGRASRTMALLFLGLALLADGAVLWLLLASARALLAPPDEDSAGNADLA